jgi:hypothetical protein
MEPDSQRHVKEQRHVAVPVGSEQARPPRLRDLTSSPNLRLVGDAWGWGRRIAPAGGTRLCLQYCRDDRLGAEGSPGCARTRHRRKHPPHAARNRNAALIATASVRVLVDLVCGYRNLRMRDGSAFLSVRTSRRWCSSGRGGSSAPRNGWMNERGASSPPAQRANLMPGTWRRRIDHNHNQLRGFSKVDDALRSCETFRLECGSIRCACPRWRAAGDAYCWRSQAATASADLPTWR